MQTFAREGRAYGIRVGISRFHSNLAGILLSPQHTFITPAYFYHPGILLSPRHTFITPAHFYLPGILLSPRHTFITPAYFITPVYFYHPAYFYHPGIFYQPGILLSPRHTFITVLIICFIPPWHTFIRSTQAHFYHSARKLVACPRFLFCQIPTFCIVAKPGFQFQASIRNTL